MHNTEQQGETEARTPITHQAVCTAGVVGHLNLEGSCCVCGISSGSQRHSLRCQLGGSTVVATSPGGSGPEAAAGTQAGCFWCVLPLLAALFADLLQHCTVSGTAQALPVAVRCRASCWSEDNTTCCDHAEGISAGSWQHSQAVSTCQPLLTFC